MDPKKPAPDGEPREALRKQLDDLDELMQRMLALSVDPPQEDEKNPPKSAGMTFAPVRQEQHFPEFDWSKPAPARDAESDRQMAGEEGQALPAFVPMDCPPSGTEESLDTAAAESLLPVLSVGEAMASREREPSEEPASPGVEYAIWLGPLVLVNRIYDACTWPFGSLGRALRSDPARSLLGILGLACIVASAAWIIWERADWNW